MQQLLCDPAGQTKQEAYSLDDLKNFSNCNQKKIPSTFSYESFRDGFILGARLMMEVVCGQSSFSEGD